MGVVGEQHQRREPSRADRVALGDRLGRIAHGVERIGDVADLLGQVRHLCDAAGIVGDRAVGIERDDDPGHGQHGGRRDGDPVEAGELMCAPDRHAHREHRRRGRLHRHPQPGDDVGAVAGGGGLRDVAHRGELGRRVVLGDHHQRRGQHEPDERGVVQVPAQHLHPVDAHARAQHPGRDRVEGDQREHARHRETAVQGVHDLAAFARLDEEAADDGSDDGHAAEHERIDHRGLGRRALEQQRAEQHRGHDGDGIGLEQVGGHAGAVPDIVADVVGDHRRIARIVLGDAGLDLAHQIRADVGALGEDASAQPREDRDQRSAEGKPHQRLDDLVDVRAERRAALEDREVAGDPEQAETDHQQSRDRAAPEGDVERRVQAAARRFRGAHVGAHRDVHSDVAGEPGEHRADQESERGRPAQRGHQADHQEQHRAGAADRHVLAIEVGARALLHRGGDLLHLLVAGRQAQDPLAGKCAVEHRHHGADECEPQSRCRHFVHPLRLKKVFPERIRA